MYLNPQKLNKCYSKNSDIYNKMHRLNYEKNQNKKIKFIKKNIFFLHICNILPNGINLKIFIILIDKNLFEAVLSFVVAKSHTKFLTNRLNKTFIIREFKDDFFLPIMTSNQFRLTAFLLVKHVE